MLVELVLRIDDFAFSQGGFLALVDECHVVLAVKETCTSCSP
jgi:hypothetical protein